MASSKEMQLRAKMKKIAAKSEQVKNKLTVTQLASGFSAIVMTPEGEATKALRSCKADRMPSAAYSNAEDLALFATRFPNNAAGWFFALVTRHADGKIRVSKEGRGLVENFRVTKFNDKYELLSAYCSWDYGVEHYKQIFDNFEFAVAGFSTPEHLQILCENPKNY